MTVNVSGFNRVDSNATWRTAYVGVYSQGLGVTNSSEGTGSSNQHVIDNIGGNRDYVMFEFSAPIVVDQAFLDYVYNGDSDISVWIGTKPNPIASHNTLSDSFLTSLGAREDNDTSVTTSRWANFNAVNKAGNVVVIAASASDTTPEDTFKLHKLIFGCQGGAPTPTPSPSCPTITVSPTTLPSGSVGQSYNKAISASGGSGPYTLIVSIGSLPTGLTLSSVGALSGTPSAEGNFTFTLVAKDNHGCTGKRSYAVTMACQTINVNPSTLPNGTVGQSYHKSISASGGSSPYNFIVSNGSLPPGLTLSSSGSVSGTPSSAGSFTFTVLTKDRFGCDGKRQYTVAISGHN